MDSLEIPFRDLHGFVSVVIAAITEVRLSLTRQVRVDVFARVKRLAMILASRGVGVGTISSVCCLRRVALRG